MIKHTVVLLSLCLTTLSCGAASSPDNKTLPAEGSSSSIPEKLVRASEPQLRAPEFTPPTTGPSSAEQQYDSPVIIAELTESSEYGNRLYKIRLIAPGQPEVVLDGISGRPWAQGYDRHEASRGAPLPAGEYVLGEPIRLSDGEDPELGGVWIAAEPLFSTNRSALGLHYDPSYGLNNGESGTEGCLAVVTESAREMLFSFAEQYRPTRLVVVD